MRTRLRHRRTCKRTTLRLPIALAAVGCLTAIFTAVRASDLVAQARLAALPLQAPVPADNPTTRERVALGRLLFWDPVLAGQKDVACATCHHPAFGYADGLDLSIGANGVGLGAARVFAAGHPARLVKRNSQTVLNAAFNGLSADSAAPAAAPMFWDLRVRSLEAQALEPIRTLEEMRGGAYGEARALPAVVARLNAIAEYRRLFARAFAGATPVTEDNLGRALAAFQRSLVAVNAPFDRYMRGDTAALTAEQLRGMDRFQSIGCVNCHSGPMFSDFTAHVLGVPDNPRLPDADAGVNGTYAFRTASLRNLSATAPYMHNGAFATLPDVVAFYQRISRGGGRRGGGGERGLNVEVSRDQIDPLARQLNMRGRGQRDLIAFFRSLDDPVRPHRAGTRAQRARGRRPAPALIARLLLPLPLPEIRDHARFLHLPLGGAELDRFESLGEVAGAARRARDARREKGLDFGPLAGVAEPAADHRQERREIHRRALWQAPPDRVVVFHQELIRRGPCLGLLRHAEQQPERLTHVDLLVEHNRQRGRDDLGSAERRQTLQRQLPPFAVGGLPDLREEPFEVLCGPLTARPPAGPVGHRRGGAGCCRRASRGRAPRLP